MCFWCDLNAIRIFEFLILVWVLGVFLLCHIMPFRYVRSFEVRVQFCDVGVFDFLLLDIDSYVIHLVFKLGSFIFIDGV